MEDCSTDKRLQQETLCHRQWTDEYVEHPEKLISIAVVEHLYGAIKTEVIRLGHT